MSASVTSSLFYYRQALVTGGWGIDEMGCMCVCVCEGECGKCEEKKSVFGEAGLSLERVTAIMFQIKFFRALRDLIGQSPED